jgi:hypothetical protein
MKIDARLQQSRNITAKTIGIGPRMKLAELMDVDASTLNDGSVLLYNESQEKFKVTNIINNPNTTILGGSF